MELPLIKKIQDWQARRERKEFYEKLKTSHLLKAYVLVLVILLALDIYHFWIGLVPLQVFLIWLSGILILALIFVSSIRVAQRDGFLNGFKNGRDGVEEHKGGS